MHVRTSHLGRADSLLSSWIFSSSISWSRISANSFSMGTNVKGWFRIKEKENCYKHTTKSKYKGHPHSFHIFNIVHSCRHESQHLLQVRLLGAAVASVYLAWCVVIERKWLQMRGRSHGNLITTKQRRRLFCACIPKVVHNVRSIPHSR